MAQNELQLIVAMKDEFSGKLDKLQASLDSTKKDAEKGAGGLKKFGTALGGLAVAYKALDFARSSVAEFAQDEQMLVRLAVLTKNSTDATNEQIYALRDQAEELEKVGVISAGNILTLQGQLATYDLTTDSIRTLTPALLDMAVAERGVNVTQQDMISFAEGVSRALQGNYASLQKRGFILSEDTKKIIENGTETERVAEITKVLNSTYEDMNSIMSQTASGSMAQMANKSDALKQSVGQHLMPVVGLLIDNFVDLITIGDGVNTTFYTIGESMWRLTKMGETMAGGAENFGRALVAPIATTGSFFKNFYKETFENGLGEAFEKGVEGASKTLDGFVDEYGKTQQDIQQDFSQIWGKTDYNPEGFDLSKLIGNGLGDAPEDIEADAKEIEKELTDLQERYDNFAVNIDDTLYDLTQSHKQNMSRFKDEIKRVKESINDLNKGFIDAEKTDRQKLAEEIVANEARIAEIQTELKQTVARDSIASLNAELAQRQASQTENTALITDLEAEIAEAKRINSLTDLQRAIEDYNARRTLATQEYNEKMSSLKMELKEIKKKEDEEKALYNKKKETLMKMSNDLEARHKLLMENNLAVTQKNIDKEIEYYKKLASAIDSVRGSNTLGSLNRSVGKVSKVDDAIISPKGDIITTHPNDYLIATKNPSELGGGGGVTIVISDNSFMGDEDMAERVGDMLLKKLRLSNNI